MSAVNVAGSWLRIDEIFVKLSGVWVKHSAVYGKTDGEWRLIDLDATPQSPEFYTWTAYADDLLGNGISLDAEGKAYVGFANNRAEKKVSLASPSLFEWTIREAGPALYTWTVYADDFLGNGISLDSEDKAYVGFATNQEKETVDLSDLSVFNWSIRDVDLDLLEELKEFEGVNENIADLFESIIFNTVSSQQKTTEIAHQQVAMAEVNETIIDESEQRVTQGKQLLANLDTQTGRVDAVVTEVSQVKIDMLGNAQAISITNGKVNSAQNTASAAYNIAYSASVTANGLAQSVTSIQNQVSNDETGLVVTNQIAQSAKLSADGNAEAVTLMKASIDDIIGSGTSTTAELQLSVGFNTADINQMKAQFYLHADANGRIAGIKGGVNGDVSYLDFMGQFVRFLRGDGTPAVFFDVEAGEFDFRGKFYAEDIQGDVTDGALVPVKPIQYSINADVSSEHLLFDITISPMPFDRVICFSGVEFEWDIYGPTQARQLWVDIILIDNGVRRPRRLFHGETFPMLYGTVPKNTTKRFILKSKPQTAFGYLYIGGRCLVQVFKQGSTITIN